MADGNVANLDEAFGAALRGAVDSELSDIERLELGLRGLREAVGLARQEYRGLSTSDRSYVDRVVGEEAQARDAAVKGAYGVVADARRDVLADVATQVSGERTHADGLHKNGLGYTDERVGQVVARLDKYEGDTNKRLDGVDTRFTGVDEKFKGVDTRLVDAERARTAGEASLLRAVEVGDAATVELVRGVERSYQLKLEESNRRADERFAGLEQRLDYVLNEVTAALKRRGRGTATAASEPAAGTASPAEGSAPA